MDYITLHQVKRQLNIGQSTPNTSDDALLMDWIRWSCELIDWWKGRRYDVYKNQIFLDAPKYYDDSQFGAFAQQLLPLKELYLNVSNYDLLEILELLNGDDSEIESSDYIKEPYNQPYINRIKLKKNSGINWLANNDGEYEQAIKLTGLFGFNKKYNTCFVDTNLEIASTLTENATSITLANVDAPAKDFISPALQAGQMIKIEDEFILIKEITEGDYNDYTIELERGYNGTDAEEHASSTSIFVYRPDGDIVQMALRLVQWRYRQKDQDTFDRTFNLATQSVTTPTSLPADVRFILGKRKAVI